MSEESMVEKVARAICIESGYEPETWAAMPDVRDECRSLARAAIEAMKAGPTMAMVRAAHQHHEGAAYLPHSLFVSMIDAALKETA